MRVVVDGQPLLPPRFGIGHYTHQLVRALARASPDDEFLVLCLKRPAGGVADLPDDLAAANLRIVTQGWLASVATRARRRLGRPRPVEAVVGPFDVFHATNYLFKDPVRTARRVVTIHDVTVRLFPQWHPVDRVNEIGAQLAATAAAAHRIVAVSASTRDDIVKHLGIAPERIDIVPNAVDASFRPLAAADVDPVLARFGLARGSYALFVGTVEPRKNLGRLLDAVESVSARLRPLVIAGAYGWGDASLTHRIRRLERAGIVRYLGYVSSSARPALMNGARLFVYPSLYEGFGFPPLEAMACGTPVVASNVSSLPEVVGDAGLLVDPADLDALAAALQRLWGDDDLRAELRRRGLERAARFSWDRTARLTLQTYRRALDTHD